MTIESRNSKITNIEIKAKFEDHDKIREILRSKGALFKGIDHQIDTYFNVNNGRLKLREGDIENNLIHYIRENTLNAKKSDVILFKSNPHSSLKDILTVSLGILVVIDKKREIYFIDNVKFHIDDVKGLGKFIEIEAIDEKDMISKEELLKQCEFYIKLFGISKKQLISNSYSDILLNKDSI